MVDHAGPQGVTAASDARGGGRSGTLFLAAGVLGAASVALLAWYGMAMRTASGAEAGAPMSSTSTSGSALEAPLTAAAEKFLASPVVLRFGETSIQKTWGELALVVDRASVAREAARLADEGVDASSIGDDYFIKEGGGARLVPVALDRALGVEALVGYKGSYDRAPVDARIDLEKRTVLPEKPGFGIDLYASMSVLEQTARGGAHEVTLISAEIPAQLTREKLGNIDVSNVMGYFETNFPVVEKDRNYNLKLAAEKLNGHVLMPGEEFSFNAVVGERTTAQGFRVAHVISAGEMIDGEAGGTCQISSTLHGAAFFAGLEIVAGRPHSRPSAYITMGMDATVVYPTTDVKLKNPYEFPVVIRFVVAQGVARVEILGKPRPYDKIVFEREVKEEIPFETITREDPTMPIGASIIEQPGFPGYKLERRRVFFKDGKKVKTEKKKIDYPPTTEYMRIGTNPDPNAVAPEQKPVHGPMDPKGKKFSMAQ
jgi:vancomycin resistance protein YoaR